MTKYDKPAVISAMSVASAAPDTPIDATKMKIGSRTAFRTLENKLILTGVTVSSMPLEKQQHETTQTEREREERKGGP